MYRLSCTNCVRCGNVGKIPQGINSVDTVTGDHRKFQIIGSLVLGIANWWIMSWTLFNAINRRGLTEQQQNVVEAQIATASMGQINYRVGGFPVGAGCCILQTDH